MGTIAKGEITLSPVNDAYTVLLTPSSCSISADFDGSNPQLSNAKGVIIVKRGAKAVPFQIVSVAYSSPGIQINWTDQIGTESRFTVTKIPNTILDGNVRFQIVTKDGMNYSTEVQFSFNMVRESTMLDWIQDWEGSKTKVGGTYIMTPKLFVGKKEAILDTSGSQPTWKEGALTGVYIGPDLLASGASSIGIYGYLKSKEIFHINANGGFIGGWTFNEGGLQSANGVVNILSEGTIFTQNPQSTTPYWGLYADGHAIFANGNVKFQADGNAEFAGRITSTSGRIAGWGIYNHQLISDRLIIDSAQAYIGINASSLQGIDTNGDLVFPATPEGGIKMWYISTNDFGFAGWKSSKKIFQVGSVNFIAGWNFDDTSFWSGSKNNSVGEYTTSGITIGNNGIRGVKWRIDSNGDLSFMNGKIAFISSSNSGEIVGWKLNESRFSTDKITLVSDMANTGLYMSAHADAQFNSRSAASLENFINIYGGIYLKVKADSANLAAYDTNGKSIFQIKSNGISHIAGWNFDNTTLYTGVAATSGYTNTGEITLGPTGLRGYKWRFENDGSGALAGGKINWDAEGNINVDAKISANNITAGTISTASIQCEGKWLLSQDGLGYLAGGNINWDSNGNLKITGEITSRSGKIGPFTIGNDGIYNGDYTKWWTEDKINLCYLNSSSLLIEQQIGYFAAGDIASLKVGIGRGSDPTTQGDEDAYCASAMYIYRKMNAFSTIYEPAIKIISDNVVNRDIAARFVGGVQVQGGLMNIGRCMEYISSSSANVIDLSFGTTILLYDDVGPKVSGNTKIYTSFWLPTLSNLRKQIGISDSTRAFTVLITVIARKDSKDFMICTQKSNQGEAEGGLLVDNNGNEWSSSRPIFGKGDSAIIALCYSSATGYYAQLVSLRQ